MLFKKPLDFLKSFGDIAYTMKENMKIQFWFLGVATLLLMTGLLYAGAVLSDFRAEPGLNKVELKWVVTAENSLKGYRVMRGLTSNSFQRIGFVTAKGVSAGEQTYQFTDDSVFKSSGRSYYYKIQFVNLDGTVSNYEKIVTVSPQISSARQTWGSLKAMFR